LVVVLRTGSQTDPPIATVEILGRRTVSPGYATPCVAVFTWEQSAKMLMEAVLSA
jgi:hypothetical protein